MVQLKPVLRFFVEYLLWMAGLLAIAATLVLNASVEAFRYAGF